MLPRKLIILAIVLPVAAFLGFRLADMDYGSLLLVMSLIGVLCVPLVLKFHHPLLILSWNLPMTLFFLKGNPNLWMVMGFISLGFAIIGAVLDKEQKLMQVPLMTWAMLGLVMVTLFTMKMTGAGLRTFGGNVYGAKKFLFILFAAVGFFAISSQRIPLAKANTYLALLVLPGAATALSNIIYMLGSGLWFLYALFPVDSALGQAYEDFSFDPIGLKIGRIGGFAVAGTALFTFLLARYGVRGVLDIRKPWRLAALVAAASLGLLGGFRSILVGYVLQFTVQFYLEGLHRTRLLPVLLAICLTGFVGLVAFVDKLPLSVQRCFTILPVDVHPALKAEAAGSTEWRWQMWEVLMPQIPKYFWVGKGYTASASDYYLTQQAMRMGFLRDFEGSLLAGDYHNGPLSVIIPFGIWGVLAFLFFLGASFVVLLRNHRYGLAPVRHINTYLLAAFIAKVTFFFFIFGAVHLDVPAIAGLVAFSISLNGGMRRASQATQSLPETAAPAPAMLNPRPAFARH
jgi:hypothetical protein